jgi:hypothetical protein
MEKSLQFITQKDTQYKQENFNSIFCIAMARDKNQLYLGGNVADKKRKVNIILYDLSRNKPTGTFIINFVLPTNKLI